MAESGAERISEFGAERSPCHVILPTAATAESDEMKIIAQKNALSVSVQNIFGLGYSPLMRAQTEEHISESERR